MNQSATTHKKKERGRAVQRLIVDQHQNGVRLIPYTGVLIRTSEGNDFEPALATTGEQFLLEVQSGDLESGIEFTNLLIEEVSEETLQLSHGRYHYLFVDSGRIVDALVANGQEAMNFWSMVWTGRPFEELMRTPFVLTGVIFITEEGKYKEAYSTTVLQAAQAKTLPQMEKTQDGATVVLFGAADSFAIGTGSPLSLETIRSLEKDGQPTPFSLFTMDSVFPAVRMSDDRFGVTFPTIDPVTLTRALTQRYHHACDHYLAHAQDFTVPKLIARNGSDEDTVGRVNFLKNNLAHAIKRLVDVIPNVSSELGQSGKAHENFIKDYQEKTQKRLDDRENAAEALVVWLKSNAMKEVEHWYRQDDLLNKVADDGKEILSCTEYVNAVSLALSRLSESPRGAGYQIELLEEAKSNSPATGVARVLDEFILPDKSHGPEWEKVSISCALGIFNSWANITALVAMRAANGEVLDFVRTRSSSGQSSLNDVLEVFARFPRTAFNQEMMELRLLRDSELGGPLPSFSRRLTSRLEPWVPDLMEKLKTFEPTATNNVGNLSPQGIGHVVEGLNTLVKILTLVEATKKDQSNAALSASALGAMEGLVAFTHEIGTLTIASKATGKVFSNTLGLVACGLALLAAEEGVRDRWEMHDWDAMNAHAITGIGAALTAYGIYLVSVSPTGGPTPVTGYLFTSGAVLGAFGGVWGLFAEDTPYEQFLKFSAFGNDPGADVKAPGWALCDNFQEWDPNTAEGIQTQLRAAEQLFHAFVVTPHEMRGAFDSTVQVRIKPSTVIKNSAYVVRYSVTFSRNVRNIDSELSAAFSGTLLLTINPAPTPSGLAVQITDDKNTFHEENTARVHTVEGDDVVEIDFNRIQGAPEPGSSQWAVYDLTLEIQYNVYGDGSLLDGGSQPSVVVPSSKSGAVFARGNIITRGRTLKDESFGSYD